MIYLIPIILLSLIIVFLAVGIRAKDYEYELWLEEIYRHLGDDITESDKTFILPHIFDENHLNIELAVERYKQLKHPIRQGNGIWEQIDKSKCAE